MSSIHLLQYLLIHEIRCKQKKCKLLIQVLGTFPGKQYNLPVSMKKYNPIIMHF